MASYRLTCQSQDLPTTSYLLEAEKAIDKTMQYALDASKWKNKRDQCNNKCVLKRLANLTDIFDTAKVKTTILTMKKKDGTNAKDSYKIELQSLYRMFAEANGLQFKVTMLNTKSPVPLIPTTEQIEKIKSALNFKFYVPISIMTETGIEAEELHITKRSQISETTGQISVIGTKRHLNGTYTLNQKLAQQLRLYLAKYTEEQPFPQPRNIGNAWRTARDKRAKEEKDPELKKIPMKNLRNYAGAVYYLTFGKDPIATKEFMRHIRLEQTMDYLRGLKGFQAKLQKIGKITTTAEEAMELILQGFKEESVFNQGTPQEKHILTKINI